MFYEKLFEFFKIHSFHVNKLSNKNYKLLILTTLTGSSSVKRMKRRFVSQKFRDSASAELYETESRVF